MTELNDTTSVAREPPKPRSFSRRYWEATREKKLLLQYDPRAGKYQFFPRPISVYDGRRDLEWREVSGKGELFSFTIAQRARPPFQGHEPFVIGLVTLDEGVNVMGNVVHCKRDEVKIGMRVKPYWLPLADGTHLLMFQPDRETPR
ncbi:MAG: Zn-ribbon domain-containing OB-fold protein [Xanthobacteraceae bacterium]